MYNCENIIATLPLLPSSADKIVLLSTSILDDYWIRITFLMRIFTIQEIFAMFFYLDSKNFTFNLAVLISLLVILPEN